MKQQTKRFLSTIFSLIFIILAFVVYFYYIQPAYRDEQAIKGRQISQQNLLNYESSAIKQVKNLIDTYQGQLQIQEAVSAALPPTDDLAGAVAQVYGLAQGSGLELQIISIAGAANVVKPASASGQGSFQAKLQKPVGSIVLQIKASGSYENFKAFLSKLETNIRIFDLKNINMSPLSSASQNKTQSADLYSFDFSVATYYQGQ